MYILLIIFAVVIFYYFFGSSGFWSMGIPVCLVMGLATSEPMWLFAMVGCFIMFVYSLYRKIGDDKEYIDKTMESIKKQNEKEKRIEKEYGTIDFTDL